MSFLSMICKLRERSVVREGLISNCTRIRQAGEPIDRKVCRHLSVLEKVQATNFASGRTTPYEVHLPRWGDLADSTTARVCRPQRLIGALTGPGAVCSDVWLWQGIAIRMPNWLKYH